MCACEPWVRSALGGVGEPHGQPVAHDVEERCELEFLLPDDPRVPLEVVQERTCEEDGVARTGVTAEHDDRSVDRGVSWNVDRETQGLLHGLRDPRDPPSEQGAVHVAEHRTVDLRSESGHDPQIERRDESENLVRHEREKEFRHPHHLPIARHEPIGDERGEEKQRTEDQHDERVHEEERIEEDPPNSDGRHLHGYTAIASTVGRDDRRG